MIEPAAFLPPAIQQLLKRKSSRDINSRFTTKLHVLLTYVSQDPSREKDVGLAWLSDTEFKMNKKTLTRVMGIKLNTINVNLRDLEFKETQRDKEGWTKWTKDGFTRSGFVTQPEMTPTTVPKNIRLGACTYEEEQQFFLDAQLVWSQMLPGANIMESIPADRAVYSAAEHFRTETQPLDNAIDVVRAIISPQTDGFVGFTDICRLLAMFGPRKSLMLKIHHLLQCSTTTGNWLQFGNMDMFQVTQFIARFSPQEPNCLVMMWPNGRRVRVWNLPLVDADGQYLVDESQVRYRSWEEYFRVHPV